MKLAFFWLTTISIIILAGCQTLNSTAVYKDQQQDVLTTQKSVIVSFLNKGLPEMAIKELRGLMAKYPDDADFKNLMGLSLLSIKNATEAIPYFQESYELQPRTSVALNLSSAYIEAGQFQQSIDLLIKLGHTKDAADYPHPERIEHNLGLASERGKNMKAAEAFYVKALAKNPSFYLTLMRLGQLYEKTKQPQRAKPLFEKARKVCNLCFDPVNALATGYMAKGNPAKAQRILRAYLKQKDLPGPDKARGKRLLNLANAATSRRRKG